MDENIKLDRERMSTLNPKKKQTILSRELITEEHKARLETLKNQNPALAPIIDVLIGD